MYLKALPDKAMATIISNAESSFILRALSEGLRVDGRRPGDARPLQVRCGEREGCVEVRLGDTKVTAVVTAELVEPYPDRATEGQLLFFVELSPMASPAFESGRPSEQAIELMRLLERSLRKSQAIDVEALCAVAGKRVWSVRTDVTVLDDRGNVADAVCAAALAALMHFRLPAVSIVGSGDEATVKALTAEQADPVPLVFHHLPVSVTLGLFRVAEGGAAVLAVDPTAREERVMVGRVVVVLNQYAEVCAMQKLGGLPAIADQVLECVRQAGAIAPSLLGAINAAMAEYAVLAAERAKFLAKTGRLPSRNKATAETIVGAPNGAAVAVALVGTAEVAVELAVEEAVEEAAPGAEGSDSRRSGDAAPAAGTAESGALGDSDEEATTTLVSQFDEAAPVQKRARRAKGTPTKAIQKKKGGAQR